MNKNHLRLIRLISDYVLLLAVFYAVIIIRKYLIWWRPFGAYSPAPYVILFMVTVISFSLFGFFERFFVTLHYPDRTAVVTQTISVINRTFMTTVIFAFMYREYATDFSYSRFVLPVYWLLSLLAFTVSRFLFYCKIETLTKNGVLAPPEYLIIGYNQLSRKINAILSRLPHYRLRGYLVDGAGGPLDHPVIGSIRDFENLVKQDSIAEVVIAQPGIDAFDELKIIVESVLYGKRVKIICENLQAASALGGGLELFELKEVALSREKLFLKRIFDLAAVLVTAPLIIPVCLLLAILVKLTSAGPVLYKQKRVGFDGNIFRIYKFRTMVVGAERKSGPVISGWDDDRCTPLGRHMRRFALDELPQLWNVLLGEMSLVGPRPERPVFVQQFIDEIPRYIYRHIMKPGLTGWAQVNGWRGVTDISERLKHDLYYLENWSFMFDLKIILRTIPVLLRKTATAGQRQRN